MKKNLMLIYAVCATVIIIGSLLWFVFSLQTDSQIGRAAALQCFKAFTHQTAGLLQDPDMQHNRIEIEKKIKQLCRHNDQYIGAVMIRTSSGTFLTWPDTTDIFSYDDQKNVHINTLPLFASAAKTILPARGQQEFIIHAILQTVTAEDLFRRGRMVFILVLILLLFTLVLLISSYLDFNNRTKTEPVVIKKNEQELSNEKEPHNAEEAAADIIKPDSFNEQLSALDNLSICTESEVNSPQFTAPEHNSFHAEKYGAFENYLKSEMETQGTVLSEVSPFFESEKQCNLAKHNYTNERVRLIEELDTAITETAIAEEDVTLLFIRLPDIAGNENIIQSVQTSMDKINKVFIFDAHTIGIIIYYTALDKAMRVASKLYEDIRALLDFTETRTVLLFGLTTRAGRLIPAHRMIEEASAAINKACEEHSDPIVAFRVNPDKYRRYLAQLTEQQIQESVNRT